MVPAITAGRPGPKTAKQPRPSRCTTMFECWSEVLFMNLAKSSVLFGQQWFSTWKSPLDAIIALLITES